MNCVTTVEITDFLTRKVNFFTPQEVLKRLSKVVKIRCCLPFVHFWHLYWLTCDLWGSKSWQLYFKNSKVKTWKKVHSYNLRYLQKVVARFLLTTGHESWLVCHFEFFSSRLQSSVIFQFLGLSEDFCRNGVNFPPARDPLEPFVELLIKLKLFSRGVTLFSINGTYGMNFL